MVCYPLVLICLTLNFIFLFKEMLANSSKLSNRILQLGARPAIRAQATNAASAPKKVEVFIDDKKVLVDPGMTILQVCNLYSKDINSIFRHVH